MKNIAVALFAFSISMVSYAKPNCFISTPGSYTDSGHCGGGEYGGVLVAKPAGQQDRFKVLYCGAIEYVRFALTKNPVCNVKPGDILKVTPVYEGGE